MDIVGTWKKIKSDACARKYPDKIEFKQNGIYQAQADTTAALHPVWDAGTFEIDGTTINMSTSNDAVIKYQVAIDNNTITFNDPDGCSVTYKR